MLLKANHRLRAGTVAPLWPLADSESHRNPELQIGKSVADASFRHGN